MGAIALVKCEMGVAAGCDKLNSQGQCFARYPERVELNNKRKICDLLPQARKSVSSQEQPVKYKQKKKSFRPMLW